MKKTSVMGWIKSAVLSLVLLIPALSYSQGGIPTIPKGSSGVYAIIDTSYNVGTTASKWTSAAVTLQNNTTTNVTGVQFRVFYDNKAFTAASVDYGAIIPTNVDLQYVDSNAQGFITITFVYTGSSSAFTMPNGLQANITFTKASTAVLYSLPSIGNLSWTGVNVFNNLAAAQSGIDTTLTTYSYGGKWNWATFKYHGSFLNVTGTGAKNLTLALEKRIKSSFTTYTGTWITDSVYSTDANGKFSIARAFDTSYYDVRLSVKGDTMSVGNVISTADAQLINKWALKTATPSGFDFYTGDVNGSGTLTIADAYGVFGRIAGRFSAWPNGVPNIKFFTSVEYNTISGSPTTNYTSIIPGVTNFTYQIQANQPDSVTYYVLVPGDANGTGYHMARLTPIDVRIQPTPGSPAATENVVDEAVNYDFPTKSVEINLPSITVNAGGAVELPVTLKNASTSVSSLQLALLYDNTLLSFRGVQNSEKSINWLSSVNANNGIIEWAGYDPSPNKDFSIPNNYEIFKLEFTALAPQTAWKQSPLYTSRKFCGDNDSKDLSINPTNGILVVYQMFGMPSEFKKFMSVHPNPTTGEFNIDFNVEKEGEVNLSIVNENGQVEKVILNKKMSPGYYTYSCNIKNLSNGLFIATLRENGQPSSIKIIKE